MTRVPGVGVVFGLVLGAACFNPTFHDPKCGPGGACPTGLVCVDGTCRTSAANDDASIDDAVEDDAQQQRDAGPTCLGTGTWEMCAAAGAAPTGTQALSGSINTDTSSMCTTPVDWTVAAQPDVCVIAGSSITISATTTVTGSRPLVLFATGSITQSSNANLDVASHRTGTSGPGMQSSACAAFPQAPTNSAVGAGGAAGGSFMTMAGDGGAGGQGAAGGLAAAADLAEPAVLRGGCRGQVGGEAATGSSGASGAGGGAVYLLAGTSINLVATINASGAAGGGGLSMAGGGGGGAGGMIVLWAPSIVSTSAKLMANGGGGGGAGGGTGGQPGFDPNIVAPSSAAPGGQSGAGNGCGGGTNGRGGNGAAAAMPATDGAAGATTNDCGGGGGGGATGYIRSNVAITGVTSSPVLTVVP
jgi:hypothetical protein